MQKVIITGGTGYIGSHTVVEFQNAGYEVVIIDNLSNSNIEVVDGIESITGKRPQFYKADVACHKAVDDVFSKHDDAIAVIHFAAYKAVGESVKKPLLYYHNNVQGIVNVLDKMQEYNILNLVFSSSCTVYGQPEKLPVTEESPVVKPESPYGNTKKINEEIIVDTLNSTRKLKAISLRYFNPIGAHESAKIGELPLGVPDNLLPYITQTAIGLRKELSVFGDDYNTPDGTAIRDYINVTDLAKAHVKAVSRLTEDHDRFEVFNVGTGKGSSVMEIILAFERSTGQELKYKIVDRRAGDVEQVWADTTKANTVLGWKAEKTLDETVKSAWEWEKRVRGESV
ncbi:MAG: UDP-glucose 4-epimerase GalE [Marinilabiliales bacterium]|nr:MAG: UDP-glucose 4-epimerase GalE [Marinilabiliales bacterium]